MVDHGNYKIIFISHYAELYGANKSLLNLIEGLRQQGMSDMLVIIPCAGSLVEELNVKQVPYRIIPFVNETWYTGANPNLWKKTAKLLYNWFVVVKNAGIFKSKKKTIIHSNSSATLFGAYCSSFSGAKHIWHIREFGMEDYKFTYNFGYGFFRYWLNKANAGIAISNAIYNKRLKESRASLRKVIYNGVVTFSQLEQRRLLPSKAVTKTFGIIGHISPEKGQSDAIDAFRLVNEKENHNILVIAGTGQDDYVNALRTKAITYGLEDCIIFPGYINDTATFYQTIDCLLMCSKNEALGRVTIEAMSYGVPVIGYNNTGTAEIIEHGKNGLLYSNGISELSEMMERIMKDDELVNRIRANAWQSVKDNFTVEQYAASVYKVYESI